MGREYGGDHGLPPKAASQLLALHSWAHPGLCRYLGMAEPGRSPPGPEVPHRNPPGLGVVAGHRLGSGSAGLLHSSDYSRTRGPKDSSPLLLREQQRKEYDKVWACWRELVQDELLQRWPHQGP